MTGFVFGLLCGLLVRALFGASGWAATHNIYGEKLPKPPPVPSQSKSD